MSLTSTETHYSPTLPEKTAWRWHQGQKKAENLCNSTCQVSSTSPELQFSIHMEAWTMPGMWVVQSGSECRDVILCGVGFCFLKAVVLVLPPMSPKCIWLLLCFCSLCLLPANIKRMCPQMAIQMFAWTTQNGCGCGVCVLCMCVWLWVWQFTLTDFQLYTLLQLFPLRLSSFVAVCVHSSSGVTVYNTAQCNSKVLVKLKHCHSELKCHLWVFAIYSKSGPGCLFTLTLYAVTPPSLERCNRELAIICTSAGCVSPPPFTIGEQ